MMGLYPKRIALKISLALEVIELQTFGLMIYFKNTLQQNLTLTMYPRAWYRGYRMNIAAMGMWQQRYNLKCMTCDFIPE